MEKFILASASLRRIEMLQNLGLKFKQKVSWVDEEAYVDFYDPFKLAEKLAFAKAESVASDENSGIVIGADTIVVYKNEIMGKPQNRQDAERMLKRLRGKSHSVISGIALINAETMEYKTSTEKTDVYFRDFNDSAAEAYLNTGEYVDKAGGYAIQGKGAVLVEKIDGCYNNVVGLPLGKLAQLLEKIGINIWREMGE